MGCDGTAERRCLSQMCNETSIMEMEFIIRFYAARCLCFMLHIILFPLPPRASFVRSFVALLMLLLLLASSRIFPPPTLPKCALLPSFRIDFFKQTASNRSNVKTTTARRQTVWLGWSVVWAGYVAMYIVLVP